jgi:hypothetical protein
MPLEPLGSWLQGMVTGRPPREATMFSEDDVQHREPNLRLLPHTVLALLGGGEDRPHVGDRNPQAKSPALHIDQR